MAGIPETGIYIRNGEWNTRQVREASAELTFSTMEVLESLVPLIQKMDPELPSTEATIAIHKAFVPDNIPLDKRNRWNNDEMWIYRFLTFMSTGNTPGRLDRTFQGSMEYIDEFNSPDDAAAMWGNTMVRMNRKLTVIQQGDLNPIHLAISSYKESRAIRFALAGQYFVPDSRFNVLEN